MSQLDLELITLTVTPIEARMLATSAALRSYALVDPRELRVPEEWEGDWDGDGEWPHNRVAAHYRELAAKVDRQRQL